MGVYQIATEKGIMDVEGEPIKIGGYEYLTFFLHQEKISVKAKYFTIFTVSEKDTGRLISWGYSKKQSVEKAKENLSEYTRKQIERQIKRKAIKNGEQTAAH